MDEDLSKVSLSDLQLAVMRTLWNKPGSSTSEVAEILRCSRNLAYTTVSTLLTRLEKRGLISATRDGRQLVYRAVVSEFEIKKSMVSDLLASLFQGSANELVSHLVDEKEIKASDLEKIRQLFEEGGKDHV
jgi:BlaI family penicillinase repressor